MKIALLCPTRERLPSIKRLIGSIIETTSNLENINLYLGIDSDDPTKNVLESLVAPHSFIKVITIPSSGEFLGLGKIWNLMVEEVSDEILSMIGDDMVFETKGWDTVVLEEFNKVKDNVLLVHFNDGMRGEGNYLNQEPLAVHSFIHRLYYETFGYYVREEWKHGFHDTWLNDVYKLAGRKVYRHDVMINHLHVSNPNSGTRGDKTSAILSRGYHSISDPEIVYNDLIGVREQEVTILKNIIQSND